MKAPARRKRPQPKRPSWFVVRLGRVQNYVHTVDGQQRVAMPLFFSRADATLFIRNFMEGTHRPDGLEGVKYSAAEIGTVDGETLDTVLAGAVGTGVDEAWYVESVGADTCQFRKLDLYGGTE